MDILPIDSDDNITISLAQFHPGSQLKPNSPIYRVSSPSRLRWVVINLNETYWDGQKCFEARYDQFDPPLLAITPDKLPILELRASKPLILSRQRRTESCASNEINKCCLRRWFVNFTEIGWNDWILQPRGYEANFCAGSCLNPTTDARSKVIADVQNSGISTDPAVLPCCFPKHKSSVTLLYTPQPGKVQLVELRDMRIDECECP